MGATIDLVTDHPEGTTAIGAALAALLRPGDVVSLTGDLGAGKTTFVQGAAHSLGVDEAVLSPTFTLVREYRGSVPVYHLDVYRLDRIQDVIDLGFEEILDQGGVVFIEWGDAVEALLPEGYLQVELTMRDDDVTGRRLAVTGRGRTWAERWEGVESVLDPWHA
jgi:tRNA threonylcarbamoyladenosine biosynthesis protein TsaE